jgi:hypothetical protein
MLEVGNYGPHLMAPSYKWVDSSTP